MRRPAGIRDAQALRESHEALGQGARDLDFDRPGGRVASRSPDVGEPREQFRLRAPPLDDLVADPRVPTADDEKMEGVLDIGLAWVSPPALKTASASARAW